MKVKDLIKALEGYEEFDITFIAYDFDREDGEIRALKYGADGIWDWSYDNKELELEICPLDSYVIGGY